MNIKGNLSLAFTHLLFSAAKFTSISALPFLSQGKGAMFVGCSTAFKGVKGNIRYLPASLKEITIGFHKESHNRMRFTPHVDLNMA